MARPLRIEYEGAVYHVTSRGNARADIYLSNEDREIYLDVLAHVVDRFGWVCHAYCLMGNHYHLMIETPQANLSRGMRQLNGMYTQRFNRRHVRVGHLFQGRFKSIIVDKDSYLLELSRYVVLNPVRAGMVKYAGDWLWSSYRAMSGEAPAVDFLHLDWLLSQFGRTKREAQDGYAHFVRDGVGSKPWEMLNGPDILGSDAFRERLQGEVSDGLDDIPRRKKVLRHLPLAKIAGNGRAQSDWIREAYRDHGYTMQAIADYVKLHHSTVSKMIKAGDENPRIKT